MRGTEAVGRGIFEADGQPADTTRAHLLVSVALGALLLLSLLPSRARAADQPRAPEGRRYALVIGIEDYEHLGKVDYARQDAEELAKVLIERAGFDRDRLRLVTDGKQPEGLNWSPARFTDLKSGFVDFTDWPRPGDTLLIFFAGHGLTVDNEAYLMPVDARDEGAGLSMTWVRGLVDKSRATTKILVLDACHSGRAVRGVIGISPDAAQGIATLVLASCAEKEISYPEDGHGVFTSGLLQGLSGLADADEDGTITGDELFAYARDYVEKWCIAHPGKKQTPQMFPKDAPQTIVARVPQEIRDAARRRAQFDAAIAEADRLLGEQKWGEAEAAFRKALAVPGYGQDARALAGLATAQGGAEALGKRQAYEAAMQEAQAAYERARPTEDQALWEEVKRLAERAAATGHADVSAARVLLEEAQKRLVPPVPAWAKVSQEQIAGARRLGTLVWKELDLGGGVSLRLVLIPGGEFMMGSAQNEVDTVVPRVDNDAGAVVLDKGKNDQVEPNLAFTVYRGKKFIARVYVTHVYERHSIARVDRTLEYLPIGVGDNATTRIDGGSTQMVTVDAVVARVDKSLGAVVLNKGKNDQVKPNLAFTVYRGKQFIARVHVIEVYERHSIARVDRTLEYLPMEVGDNATTRFDGGSAQKLVDAVVVRVDNATARFDCFPHRVRITKPLYVGVTEVTNAQYDQFVRDSSYDGSKEADGDYMRHHREWAKYASAGADYPVVCVSWNNAQAFCRWLSRKTGNTVRLPTEAEWEYACRAATTTRFSFGDSDGELGSYAWHVGNSGDQTHPIAQKRPNAWGLYDMHGNLWEWCHDWYDAGYYSKSPTEDPQGPASGTYRVLRSGSWSNDPGLCRSAYRVEAGPAVAIYNYGFRVVVSSQ